MCLAKITRRKGLKQEGAGWKVFAVSPSNGKLYSPITESHIVTGEWINEADYRPPGEPPPEEGYGFHIFLQKRDAQIYRLLVSLNLGYVLTGIKRVRWRKPVARGYTEPERPTVVAKEIFIEG